jgi:GNAT superfamily N-acetyltransferase
MGCITRRSSTGSGAQMREDRPCQHAEGITLRPIRPGNEGFLYDVYASTRLDELAALGWSDAQREAFLRMQFRAQHQSYLAQFPMADFAIILRHERPIGRLYIERKTDEMRGIDIALLPEYRQAGIGTAILRDLLSEAARDGKPFRHPRREIQPRPAALRTLRLHHAGRRRRLSLHGMAASRAITALALPTKPLLRHDAC